jgi:hypothetical protein
MESEEDVLIEAEIQRDLDKLTEADLEWSQSSNVELSNSDNSLSDDANLVVNFKIKTFNV